MAFVVKSLFSSIPRVAVQHCYSVVRWRKKFGKLGKVISRIQRNRLVLRYGIFLSPTAVLGQRLVLPHPTGIVIGDGVQIGSNVTIYQHVTLGRKFDNVADYPIIGNNVTIYAGAVVLGAVSIGDGATIAANAVVTKNVPPNTTFAGVPAKRIS